MAGLCPWGMRTAFTFLTLGLPEPHRRISKGQVRVLPFLKGCDGNAETRQRKRKLTDNTMTDFDISEVASEIEDMSYQEKMEYLDDLRNDLQQQLDAVDLLISDLQTEHDSQITAVVYADIDKYIQENKLGDKITFENQYYYFNYGGYQYSGLLFVDDDDNCNFRIEPHNILNNAKAANAITTLGDAIGIPATDNRVEISADARDIAAKIIDVLKKIGV